MSRRRMTGIGKVVLPGAMLGGFRPIGDPSQQPEGAFAETVGAEQSGRDDHEANGDQKAADDGAQRRVDGPGGSGGTGGSGSEGGQAAVSRSGSGHASISAGGHRLSPVSLATPGSPGSPWETPARP